MGTISWVVGSAAPVQIDLRQDDGTASAVTAVEVGINVNGVCQRIAATADGDAWAFTAVGIPVGYHRAQIWWDAVLWPGGDRHYRSHAYPAPQPVAIYRDACPADPTEQARALTLANRLHQILSDHHRAT